MNPKRLTLAAALLILLASPEFTLAPFAYGADAYTVTQWGISTDKPVPGDYDGDGKVDVAVWRPSTGIWYIRPSASPGTFTSTQLGASTDIPVPGDYDGDGKSDVAVWRPSTGVWYTRPSTSPSTVTTTQFGASTDVTVPGNYDGDGKDDVAVWRPSTGIWYIRPSASPGTFTSTQWGASSDVPVIGDYDADGKTDVVVWRPSTGFWYVRSSASPGTFTSTKWGTSTDVPVRSRDYDGDGKKDLGVWRSSSGTWYFLAANGTYTSTQWGGSSDIPVPMDYDGDGKRDVAVWRPSSGTWYILIQSPAQYTLTVQKAGTGSGTVTSSPSGINCGSSCTAAFNSGAVVTLTAAASSGSTFAGWSGGWCSGTGSCIVTMDQAKTVTGTFNLPAICTPNQTLCVAGNISAVKTCNATGTAWNQSTCPSWSLCSNSACRTVCDITSTPSYPTACMVPNADGVNDGDWITWSDSSVAVPTRVKGGSVTDSGGRAPIYSSGLTWPYSWSISSMDSVGLNFTLNQYGVLKHPRLSFKAMRAGIITGYTNNYLVGVFNGNTSIAQCAWGPVPYSYASTNCYVSSPYNSNFNYSGGWNGMLLNITGDGYGHAIDLLDVNYIYLSIEP